MAILLFRAFVSSFVVVKVTATEATHSLAESSRPMCRALTTWRSPVKTADGWRVQEMVRFHRLHGCSLFSEYELYCRFSHLALGF